MSAPTTTPLASDPWEMALIHRLIRRGFEQAKEFVLGSRRHGARRRRGGVRRLPSRRAAGPPLDRGRADLARSARAGQPVGRPDHAAWRSSTWACTTPSRRHAASCRPGCHTDRSRIAVAGHGPRHRRRPVDRAPCRGGAGRRTADRHAHHPGRVGPPRQGRFSKFTPKQRFTAMGEMLEAASPTEAARMMAGLPAPIKVIWRLVGRGSTSDPSPWCADSVSPPWAPNSERRPDATGRLAFELRLATGSAWTSDVPAGVPRRYRPGGVRPADCRAADTA